MSVQLVSQCFLLAIVLKHPGDVDGQLTAPSSPTCPGSVFTFDCTVMPMSGMNAITLWRVNGSRDLCILSQISTNPDDCGPNNAITASPVRENATSFLSTLSGTADPELDGILVECFGPDNNVNMDNRVGESPIQIVGQPSVNFSCVDLSEAASGFVNVTVNLTMSGGDSADFYLINITTNASQIPYGGLLNITASVTQHELTGFMAGYEYNITVRGVTANCGGLVGRESEPLTITPQVPEVSINCTLTLSYNQSSGRLLSIFSTWTSVPDPIDPDPGEICPGPSGNVTRYQINFETGSFIVNTSIVNTTMCKARTCNYTFEPPSNPPSSYDRVSVVAENVVGVGDARNLTTQPINTTNNLLTANVVDVSFPDNVTVNCTFLPGFTGSAHCTVKYGNDPTYMNLPYSAESTETGTAGDTVSVVLREQLNSSTVYYYNVSAVSGNLTVVVIALPFVTGCFLNELWNLPAPDAIFRNDVSLLENAAQYPSCDDGSVGSVVLVNTTLNTATVAYYTGTIAGSRACFVCNNGSGYAPNTTISNERVCQNDGRWSRTPVVCGCSLRELWDLSAAGVTLLPNVSSLGDAAAQYPSCNVGSVGSVVLRDNRLNTATVAYYTGTTPGSRACFVCDESSGHGLNTTVTERVCQNDAAWSGSPIICESSSNVGTIVGSVVGTLAFIAVAVAVIIVGVWIVKYTKMGKWILDRIKQKGG